jgi:hypothetical protein
MCGNGVAGRAPAPPASDACAGTKAKGLALAEALKISIAVVGIDLGKKSFHVVGLDNFGVIRHECGTGCGGRSCAFDEWRVRRTAKSCGPDVSTLASSS